MSGQTDMLTIIRRLGGDPADLPFWRACREGRFLLHRCGICGRHYWPASRCVVHGNQNMAWVEALGRGVLHTFTIMHHAFTPSMKAKLPYVVGVIQLEEGPFFHSNILGCAPEEVKIGMKLRAEMILDESGLIIPVFYPA
jgi:uncharacterized OB-fold protein